jgi:hypothetical protein
MSGNDEGVQTLLYEDINFEEIDDDLAAFQEDDMVQQALHRGVDLKKYAKELEKELKEVGIADFLTTNELNNSHFHPSLHSLTYSLCFAGGGAGRSCFCAAVRREQRPSGYLAH